jgi:hypothetical protein
MCSKVRNSKATVLVRSPVYPVSHDDLVTSGVRDCILEFDAHLREKLKERHEPLPIKPEDTTFIPYENTETPTNVMPEADDMDHEAYNKFISARVWLPSDDGIARPAKITGRNANPVLDISLYEVEFDDGRVGTYSANIIAQNIFEQVDDEGQAHLLFDDIKDHRKGTDAVAIDDGFEIHNNRRTPKRTTCGWTLLVQWKDGSTTWIPLKDLKESNPLQVADYVVAHKLTFEPAFFWWVPHVLRKRDRIIKQANPIHEDRPKVWA